MEQGPDELGERPNERAEDLERLTDKPLDEQAGAGSEDGDDADVDTIDPGL